MPVRDNGIAFDSDNRRCRDQRRNLPAARCEPGRKPRRARGGTVSARLRVIVADDERPARSFLLALLRSFEDVAVVGEAASGKQAVAIIEKERPDLALLDWQMPELDGIGVVRMLAKGTCPLIAFVTAYDEYAGARVRDERGRLSAEAGREGAAPRDAESRAGAARARRNRRRANGARRRGSRHVRDAREGARISNASPFATGKKCSSCQSTRSPPSSPRASC